MQFSEIQKRSRFCFGPPIIFSIVDLELLLYCGVYEGSRVSERRQQLIIDGLQVISELCKVCSVQTLVAIL